jgi:hypothetical protein
MKKFVLPISTMMVLMLLVGTVLGCTPVTNEDGGSGMVEVIPGVGATVTAVPYPIEEGGSAVIEPVPAEGTRPYPSFDERRVEALPAPAIVGPGYPGTGEGTPVIGEVPEEIMDEIIADVVERAGVERSAVNVLKSEQVVWPDGSLGCPQPGMVYTQALVNGYHVVLEQGGKSYDYRVTERGSFVLCESRLNRGIPATDAGTPTE